MSAITTIPASAGSMFAALLSMLLSASNIGYSGRSIFCQNRDTIASSNLLNGVDWYTLSSSKLIASSKVPISQSSSASPLAYVDSDDAIIIGGLSGRAYIVSCRTFDILEELEHRGA